MSQERGAASSHVDTQMAEMTARVTRSEADIAILRKEAVEATHRAGASDGRADRDRQRIEALEARAVVDRELLDELTADGLVQRDRAAQLQVALQSARVIGAAIGIVMVKCGVTETAAFDILKTRSNDTNRKLRAVAEEILVTGDVSRLARR